MARDPEHIRKYPQFQNLETWINEGADGSMFAHFGKVIKKTALRRRKHPGNDAVSVIRKIFQGTDSEVVIMENAKAWKIMVVDFEVPPKYHGPVADLIPDRKLIKPMETKASEGDIGGREEWFQSRTEGGPKKFKFK